MTTALPAATTAVASAATQGDVKNWITGIHDFLQGLLGTDGTAATALATLGVVAGVSSVNGNAGAVTAAQIAAATIAGLGYTPPSSAVPTDSNGGVGCFAFLALYSGGTQAEGTTAAGGALRYCDNSGAYGTATPVGTWRCLGNINGGTGTVFQRIA